MDHADRGRIQHEIGELIESRAGIESEKITERKKSASRLRELLQLGHIVEFIDNSTSARSNGAKHHGKPRSSGLTWTALFRSITTYVSKETDSISKLEEKGSSSTTAYTNRETKKKDVAEVMRIYCKSANKRGPHLPLTELLDHMMMVVSHKRLGTWFGKDYTQILLDHVLTVPHYVVHITATKWDELLQVYCDLFLSRSFSDHTLLSRIIHTLISQCVMQCDITIHLVCAFFEKAFAKMNEEKNPKVLEHLLASLNAFSAAPAVAVNARGRLSKLGEDVFSNVLPLWNRCQASVRDQIIDFLRIQLRIHHPRGTHTDEQGAWAADDTVWGRNLEKLYDLIVADFESASARLRLAGKSEGSQKFELVDLAADVICQVEYLRAHSSSHIDPTVHRGKRHKAQSCWTSLSDALNASKDNPSVIGWLQLLSWLVSKYPDSLPTAEYLPLLSQLHKMLRETKRAECTQWLLICLCVLSLNPSSTSNTLHDSQSRDLWRKIWHTSLKTLSVHTAEESGYQLVAALLDRGLVEKCDLEVWKLLNPALNLPIRPIVSFLASILNTQCLPESLYPKLATPLAPPITTPTQTQAAPVVYTTYPLRVQLLQFLLPISSTLTRGAAHSISGFVPAGFISQIPITSMKSINSTPAALSAHLLVALTQRSCSSAQVSFLRQFYLPDSPADYIRELLDPSFTSTYTTNISNPFSSPPSCSELLKCNLMFEANWNKVERVYLESTFDVPVTVPCLDKKETTFISLSRENTITGLQELLLELMAKRAEVLLQPTDIENLPPSVRERSQHLVALMESQAHHCCLILHTLLLLCHCEAVTEVEQLRRTPVIRALPGLLKAITQALKDPLWREVEKPLYFQAARTTLERLQPLVHFAHLDNHQLSGSVKKAKQVVRKVCELSLPKELMEVILKLAMGKLTLHSSLSHTTTNGSTVSFGGSSNSASRSASVADSHCSFDDDMDIAMSENSPLMQSESSVTQMTSPSDILSVSCLNDKTACQLKAAEFLCYWYQSSVSVVDTTDGTVGTSKEGGDKRLGIDGAILSMLNEDNDLKSPIQVQTKISICHILLSGTNLLKMDMLESLLDVLSNILNVHRKNQAVYGECLSILKLAAVYLAGEEGSEDVDDRTDARESCVALLSSFWSLYQEGLLSAPVRIQLACLVQELFERDRSCSWTTITVKKKKKKGESIEESSLTLRDALVKMVNDVDHGVRMHMASTIATLFVAETRSCDSHVTLLSRNEQEKMYETVEKMLHKAHLVTVSQDELSAEDDSVNRVSSMISTLQHEACVSPVCERKVVSLLMSSVGMGQIDMDVAKKALVQIARYLGYENTRRFMEDILISLVSSWMDQGAALSEIPLVSLMDYGSVKDFFSLYHHQIVPYLVMKQDVATLEHLSSEVLHVPLPELLKESVPTCMVLILTNYVKQGDSDEESQERRRQKAAASHDLLNDYLTQEVVAQTIQHSIDEFVVELLSHMCEPHTAGTHLAKYCLPSDPQPCPPFFSSLVVRATLDYMPNCYGSSAVGSTFVRLLSKRKDHIQRILLSLTIKLESSHRPFAKRHLLLAYYFFVKLLCKELKDTTHSFLVMDITHMVVRILSNIKSKENMKKELFGPCCDTLETLCKASLEVCPQELGKHLHTIVTALMSFAQETESIGKQALSLLSFLLFNASTEHLSELDPFPNVEPFTLLHQRQVELREEVGGVSLSEEISRFLSVGQACPQAPRTEGLRFLRSVLHNTRQEMTHLIKINGNSIVLKLIQGLVTLCQSSSGTWSREEVACCLGEIGPKDLGCIAIPTTKESAFDVSQLPSNWSPSEVYTAKILYLLTMLLMDREIKVVRASGDCLRSVIATQNGLLVLSKLEKLGQETTDWCLYLEPFKQQTKKKSLRVSPPAVPSSSSFLTLVDTPTVWLPSEGVSHREWITRLVTTLISSGGVTDSVLLAVKPVCLVKVELCEEIFPLLIYDILSTNRDDFRSVISNQIQLFFSTVSTTPRPSTPSPLHHPHSSSTTSVHPDSIRTMLNMVTYLRGVDRPKVKKNPPSTPWDNNFWLDLNFLDVAMAAQICSAYFTSLLYIEIWHGAVSGDLSPLNRQGSSPDRPILMDIDPSVSSGSGQSSLTGTTDDPTVQKLFLEAYSRIGEPDSLYGACSMYATNESTRVRLYEHEGQWHKLLSTYNLQAQTMEVSCETNIAESLHQLGLTHVLNMYLRGLRSEGIGQMTDVAEYQYEAAWRCTIWDEGSLNHMTMMGDSGVAGFHQSVCSALAALKDGEAGLLQNSLTKARTHVIQSLCSTGLESTYSLYPFLTKLLCLVEMEEASKAREATSKEDDLCFLKDWKERLLLLDNDFQFVEPVLAVRCAVLHSLLQSCASEIKSVVDPPTEMRRKTESLFEALTQTLLTQTKLARDSAKFQVSEAALFTLRHLYSQRSSYFVSESLFPSLSWTLQIEEAKLYWERGERLLAMSQLKNLIKTLNEVLVPPPDAVSLYPTALSLYGSWLAETRSENPTVIMTKYLERSVEIMENSHSGETPSVVQAYLTLARYADNQYQRIKRHMESAAFESKRQLLLKSQQELKKLESQINATERQRSRHVRTLKAQNEEDEEVLRTFLEDKQHFLEKALKNYVLCLRKGDEHDLRVFRLCALWFANYDDSTVNEIIQEGACQLESRKFLPLMYQLAARMSSSLSSEPFQHVLQAIIYRTTLEHPHHCLYVILALSNASKDNLFPTSGHVTGTRNPGRTSRLSRTASTAGASVDEDKVKAATTLIEKLRSEKPALVNAVEQLCSAYIDLAYHDVSAHKTKRVPLKLPSSCPLLKLKKMKAAIPTLDIEVDPTCRYDNVVCIERFDSYFQLAGGVNLPKVMSCIGSDGKRRKQLVKGRDDLRQDAVMQQIFVLVNQLLKREPATKKRRLCVRTYKVIPLSQRSGIVEWCEGTLPLGEYLVCLQNPASSAHSRYRPGDWSSVECRKKITGLTDRASRLQAYLDICKNFKPVFHHFFTENFPSPPQWFERRLAYTRSVAASSIVGYVVGLGDRHVQNILIDTNTAELIHIDLGVAFEQGKTLPTPETVPFRLTRDVVDGMGIAGVEGVFRRCCEETMSLMRLHQEELRTIVEVLLHDPLYQWTVSPLKAKNIQCRTEQVDETASTTSTIFDGEGTTLNKNPNSSTNKMAERVLLRLQEKLEGIEDGVPLSCSGQVNLLIQEATDPANLCVLFQGWQPWI